MEALRSARLVTAFECLRDASVIDQALPSASLVRNRKNNEPGWIELIFYMKALVLHFMEWMSKGESDFEPYPAEHIVAVLS